MARRQGGSFFYLTADVLPTEILVAGSISGYFKTLRVRQIVQNGILYPRTDEIVNQAIENGTSKSFQAQPREVTKIRRHAHRSIANDTTEPLDRVWIRTTIESRLRTSS